MKSSDSVEELPHEPGPQTIADNALGRQKQYEVTGQRPVRKGYSFRRISSISSSLAIEL